jgi:DnaJ-class molecular chaperone
MEGKPQNHYEALGLTKHSSESEIKTAYKKMALEWHPDRNPDKLDIATERFKAIAEAYSVLSDVEKKRKYDESIARAKGPDIFYILKVTLAEMYCGCVKQLSFRRNRVCTGCEGSGGQLTLCSACHGHGIFTTSIEMVPGFVINRQIRCLICSGSGKIICRKCSYCEGKRFTQEECTVNIQIQRGSKSGHREVFLGKSHELLETSNFETGDFVVVLEQIPHEIERHENNLLLRRTIPLIAALCGFTIEMQHLDDRKISFNVSDIISPGHRRIIPNEGMILQDGTRGDLHIEFSVEFPKSLTAHQKQKMLETLKE